VSENQELPGRLTVAGYLNYLRPFYPMWDKQLEAETLKQFPAAGGPEDQRAVTWDAGEAGADLRSAVPAEAAGAG